MTGNALEGVISKLPLYPALGAMAFVLGVASGTSIPGEWLIRPVLVAGAATGIVQLLLWGATRDRHLGAALAAAVVAAVAGAPALPVVAGAAIGLLLWITRLGSERPREAALPRLTPAVNVLAMLWVAVSSVGAGSRIADIPAPMERVGSPRTQSTLPNVYVILVDGYARSDSLAAWGFDNSPFVDALEERGFNVATGSRSDYDYTGGTVPSIMQMSLLEDLDLQWPDPGPERDQMIWSLTNDSPALAALRSLGYQTFATESHSAPASVRSVDRFLETGRVTEFEAYLIEATRLDSILWQVVPTWLPDEYRQRVLQNFDSIRDVAELPAVAPRFVWGHVLMPHAPFVFRADGGLARPVSCYPATCGIGAGQSISIPLGEFIDRYTQQVRYTNYEVIKTIDAILATDSDAVIVVLSDHGSRYDAQRDYDEWLRNFFPARTPGFPGIYGEEPRPRDLFRVLLGTYFGPIQ